MESLAGCMDREAIRTHLVEAIGLKTLERAGWLRAGITSPESVASHSWGVAWLAIALCPEGLDMGKVASMAVLHDLAEVRIGDITPHDNVSAHEKREMEESAFRELVDPLPNADAMYGLWLEVEDGTSPEGRFVKACDKLDMALQASVYSEKENVDVGEFIASAVGRIDDDFLLWLADPKNG